jgi:hypothetical protein
MKEIFVVQFETRSPFKNGSLGLRRYIVTAEDAAAAAVKAGKNVSSAEILTTSVVPVGDNTIRLMPDGEFRLI